MLCQVCQLISIIYIICVITITNADKGTIIVFGGNGFVGRRICEQGIARAYRVISISRSGCPNVWKNAEWAKKVEWYQADALKKDTYADYLSKQNPIAVFTMMGTLTPKQMYRSVQQIFEYAGTTNLNVCNVASNIKTVQKFVYIGAPVKELGINPSNENNTYALWTQFWFGQYKAKLAMENCVQNKFGENGMVLRPSVLAGINRKEIFGTVFEYNRFPFYDSSKNLRKFYKFIYPPLISATDLANDALDFIEGGGNKFKCASHSKKPIDKPSPVMQIIMDNVDNIILVVISGLVILCVYSIINCIQ